jgi:alpha-galactosidase/6-phospho-beta-glucosidase family protein
MSAWEQDIEIPARYGIYMHIADSIGPGGIMRAFRHAPVMASICRDLREVSPRARVLNYTNPATANALAMRTVPEIESASLCSCTINHGSIDNLPGNAVVEVTSVVNSYGIRPLHAGPLPEPIAANLRHHISTQQMTVQAALSGDRKDALQAFLLDPVITAHLNPDEAGKLLDELLQTHSGYLPRFA